MTSDVSIIGGADGPTYVFLAGELGMKWLNIFGLIFVVLILIPNIVYAVKNKDHQNLCTNRFMNVVEQIGRYACMFFMVFNLGLAEFGFGSVGAFLFYIFGNIGLILAYWIIWILYFKKMVFWKQMALAIIPVCIFLLNGITLRHYLLIVSAVIFAVGHIYVTRKNRVDN